MNSDGQHLGGFRRDVKVLGMDMSRQPGGRLILCGNFAESFFSRPFRLLQGNLLDVVASRNIGSTCWADGFAEPVTESLVTGRAKLR